MGFRAHIQSFKKKSLNVYFHLYFKKKTENWEYLLLLQLIDHQDSLEPIALHILSSEWMNG